MPQQYKAFILLWHIKGLRRTKHTVNTSAACRQGKVVQVEKFSIGTNGEVVNKMFFSDLML
jgi:hypothetical protein